MFFLPSGQRIFVSNLLFCCRLRLLPLLSAAAFTGFSLVAPFTHMEAERDCLGGEDGLWSGCCLPWAGRPQAPVGQLCEDSLCLPRADCREGPRQGCDCSHGCYGRRCQERAWHRVRCGGEIGIINQRKSLESLVVCGLCETVSSLPLLEHNLPGVSVTVWWPSISFIQWTALFHFGDNLPWAR